MSARKPRLLVIGPTPPPHHGISTFMERLLVEPALHAAFDVIHLDNADRRNLENLGRLDYQNVRLALQHIGALAWLVLRHRPDIVYFEVSQNAWAYLRDSFFMTLPRLARCRVAVRLNGSDFRNFHDRSAAPLRHLIRTTSKRLDGVAVLGEALRGIYAGLVPAERVSVVPNGTADLYADGSAGCAAEERANERAPLTVTYLGVLYKPKGLLDFLAAAARLRDAGSSARFVAAGSWFSEETRAEALAFVERAGLEDSVTFPGVVAGEAKLELFRESDVLVFPGIQNEGQPYVILEAMAAALPVVSTAKGAIADMVVDGETGFLVPARAPDALAAAIARLEHDGELRRRLGRAARARFLDRFTDERALDTLITWLIATAAGRAAAGAPDPLVREVAT